MSEVELLEKLADTINRLTKPAIPLSVDLWDVATFAQFVKRSDSQVRRRSLAQELSKRWARPFQVERAPGCKSSQA
jgi:hypothetical protein